MTAAENVTRETLAEMAADYLANPAGWPAAMGARTLQIARGHKGYSARNMMLIANQLAHRIAVADGREHAEMSDLIAAMDMAADVMPRSAWRDRGFEPMRGHGLAVFGRFLVAHNDDGTTSYAVTPEDKQAGRVSARMKVTAAFHCGDVRDESGKPAEPVAAPDFTELDAVQVWDALRGWIVAQGWKVTRTRTGDSDGFTAHARNLIAIHAGLDAWDAVRTLIHEIAHAFLHGADDDRPYVGSHRGDIEAEAESVTFAVLTALGRDARGSVAYAAGWTRDADRVAAAFDRAANVADALTRVALGESGVTVETTRKDAREAAKVSNRELAAAMREAGLNPSGDAWRMAKAGTPIAELVTMAAAS